MSTPLRKNISSNRRPTQRGAAVMLEFVLATTVFLPLTLGTAAVGLALQRFLQVSSVCRSSASMFVRGADFSQTSYQRVLGKIATGLGMTDTSGNILTDGNGEVIFSVIMRVGDSQCASLGYGVGDGRCINRYKAVVTKRVVVGNSSLRASGFGQPVGGSPQADGSYSANFYVLNSSAVVSAFGTAADNNGEVPSAPMHLAAGEVTYLAEACFRAPEINLFPSYLNINGYYFYNFF